jgi:hypothetical protein
MDSYMNAVFLHDPHAVPKLAADVRMNRNTGAMDVGKGAPGVPSWWTNKRVWLPPFRCSFTAAPAAARPLPLLVLLQNLVTMEVFAIHGLIHHVEVFPFVTVPYGLGNGWTSGSGR